jgi:HEAT repeat protein
MFLSALFLLFSGSAVFPDSIILKNGSIIEGVVSKDNGKQIVLSVVGGEIVISHTQIETIIQSDYIPEEINYENLVNLPQEIKTNVKPATTSAISPAAVTTKTNFALSDENRTPEQVEINKLLNKIMEKPNEAWQLTPEIVAKGKEETPYLTGLLSGITDISLKRWIIYILGQIKSPETIETLTGQLKDSDENIRTTAVNALRFSKSTEVQSVLKEMLSKDASVSVKISIINAFSEWGDASIIPLLITLLGSDDNSLYSTIVDTLVQFHQNMGKEGHASFDIISILNIKIHSANEATRRGFIDFLGRIKDKEAKEVLVKFLTDEDPETRRLVVKALVGVADKEIIKILSNRLSGETNILVKIMIIHVFQESANYEVIPILIETLQEKNQDICLAASRALRIITKRSFGANYEAWKKWWDNLQGK